jgi:hypothetical protein
MVRRIQRARVMLVARMFVVVVAAAAWAAWNGAVFVVDAATQHRAQERPPRDYSRRRCFSRIAGMASAG